MFVDACAIVAVLLNEIDRPAYEDALDAAADPFTSPLAAWEAIIVLARPDRFDMSLDQTREIVVAWLDDRNIGIRETGLPRDQLRYAVAVAETHGLGKRALSNFDCFHYAHAKVAGVPLLTLDRLLRETGVETLPAATRP